MELYSALTTIGGRPAIIEDGVARTGTEIARDIDALAGMLRARGVSSAILRSTSAYAHVAGMAASQIADVDISLAHPSMPQESIDQIIAGQHIDSVFRYADGRIVIDSVPAAINPAGESAVAIRGATDSPRVMMMTSGTTSAPKVAAHSLASLCGRIAATESSRSARWLLTYSPSTFAGLQVVLTAVIGGGTLVSLTDRNPVEISKALVAEDVTHISGTPSFYRTVLAASAGAGLHSMLRQITVGGEAVDQTLLDQLKSQFPRARVGHIYASTEAGMVFNVTDGLEGFPASWLANGAGDVGLRIRDGELEVRTPRRMDRYASDHASPLADDGWMATGDLVHVDGERVRFVGRSDIRINVGGYKVAPEEVERALLCVPGVADAHVTGTSSPLTGQMLVATLVCADGIDPAELKAEAARRLREQLDAYKVPRIYRFVDSIATTSAGKKQRA